MSLLLKMGKPLGMIAAILSIVQGLIWFILTVLGLLVFTCTIDMDVTTIPAPSDIFLNILVQMYFLGESCTSGGLNTGDIIMTPYDVHIWVSINLAINLIWIIASIYYLVELVKKDGEGFGAYGWVGTTCLVLIMDLATAIAFGIDYGAILSEFSLLTSIDVSMVTFLLVPMFLVTLAMRGFVLWIVNDVFVIIIITSLAQKRKDKKLAQSRNLSRQASFVNPTMTTMYPDSVDNRTNNQQRGMWEPMTPADSAIYPYSQTPVDNTAYPYSQTPVDSPAYPYSQRPSAVHNNYERPPGGYSYMAQDQPPHKPIVLSDPPKGRPPFTGQYVAPPKHIPSPDYSPPSNHKDMLPIRPVLRKPPGKIGQIGRTVF